MKEEERIRNQIWKESKKKQAEIEEEKMKQMAWERLMSKESAKEETLYEVRKKR